MKQIWGLTDGSAGMASQVRGVGEALAKATGGEFTMKTARRMPPFSLLPGYMWRGAGLCKSWSSDALKAPWPDVLITSGRRCVAFALWIKHKSHGHTKIVHLQSPRVSLKHFDLVMPMEHDKESGDNIYPTFAALHHITLDKLSRAAYEFHDQVMSYPPARIVMLIGGATNKYKFTPARQQQLIGDINNFAKSYEGSLFISTSRRTGQEAAAAIEQAVASRKYSWVYNGRGDNPYLAWLATADAVVVTNDSVSMMSEVLATGKPLYILSLPEHEQTKPARFARQLIARGMARAFTFPLQPYQPDIYNEVPGAVQAILYSLA